MACDRREVTGAPLRSPALRGQEHIRLGNSRRTERGRGLRFQLHKKLSETDSTREEAACNFGTHPT